MGEDKIRLETTKRNVMQSNTLKVVKNNDKTEVPVVSTKFQGCRIIDLSYIIQQLKDGCDFCGNLLNLANLETDTKIGIASIFYIKCSCSNVSTIYSSQYHNRRDDDGNKINQGPKYLM